MVLENVNDVFQAIFWDILLENSVTGYFVHLTQ